MSVPIRVPGFEPAGQPLSAESQVSRSAVLEQLDRILASPIFNHSKRCGPLLRFIVMQTLDGQGAQLKERAIGMSVFGRDPAYDTTEDPIVRTSAVEVRKRIAQYYHQPGREAEVRIDLISGSYVPKFCPAAERTPNVPVFLPEAAPDAQHGIAEAPVQATPRPWLRWKLAFLAIAVLAAGVAAAVAVPRLRAIGSSDPVAAFWHPLMEAETVTLVMGNTGEMLAPATAVGGGVTEPTFYETVLADRVGFVYGMTVARVAALFRANGKKFEIRRGGSLTLQDLRKAPAVLVGALNNPWTSLLEEKLRFRFIYDSSRRATYFYDQQKGGQLLWITQREMPYASLKEDRAIISRFVDPRTEQPVVLVAGFGRDGTAAAGEFITEPKYLELLVRQAPPKWDRKNLQVVIATDLINGHSGPPRILATYFW